MRDQMTSEAAFWVAGTMLAPMNRAEEIRAAIAAVIWAEKLRGMMKSFGVLVWRRLIR